MIKKYVIIVLTVLFILISGICYSCNFNKEETVLLSSIGGNNKNTEAGLSKTDTENITAAPVSEGAPIDPLGSVSEIPQPDMIAVHICGAVKQPGVFEVFDGSRLFDVIELSGGFDKDAASDFINQAEKVIDGQRYYIPTKKELEDLSAGERIVGDQSNNNSNNNNNSKNNNNEDKAKSVNINTADATELMNLPGIGEAKAKSIIDYRNNNGKFKTTDEIMKIPGIKEGLFNRIASMIVAK